MPCRSRASSGRCIARPIGSCCTTSPADGRVLLSRNTIRINLTCKRPGDTSERDLTWQLASAAKGISPDGETLIFEDELLSSPSGNPVIFSRNIEGSPAISIGEGSGAALSPDGKWVLALRGEDLVLLPTGVGATVTLPKGDLVRIGNGAWLPDSKRIVFTGYTADNTPRGYLQEIPAGLPRAITPSGVVLADKSAARDENAVLGRARRHVGAFSDSRRGWPARSSAHAWRYPASMEPRRPIRVHRRQRRWGQAGSR